MCLIWNFNLTQEICDSDKWQCFSCNCWWSCWCACGIIQTSLGSVPRPLKDLNQWIPCCMFVVQEEIRVFLSKKREEPLIQTHSWFILDHHVQSWPFSYLPFLPWKWKMASSKLSFLWTRVIFHFHDYWRMGMLHIFAYSHDAMVKHITSCTEDSWKSLDECRWFVVWSSCLAWEWFSIRPKSGKIKRLRKRRSMIMLKRKRENETHTHTLEHTHTQTNRDCLTTVLM